MSLVAMVIQSPHSRGPGPLLWAIFYVTMEVISSRSLYFGSLALLYEIEEVEGRKMGAT